MKRTGRGRLDVRCDFIGSPTNLVIAAFHYHQILSFNSITLYCFQNICNHYLFGFYSVYDPLLIWFLLKLQFKTPFDISYSVDNFQILYKNAMS